MKVSPQGPCSLVSPLPMCCPFLLWGCPRSPTAPARAGLQGCCMRVVLPSPGTRSLLGTGAAPRHVHVVPRRVGCVCTCAPSLARGQGWPMHKELCSCCALAAAPLSHRERRCPRRPETDLATAMARAGNEPLLPSPCSPCPPAGRSPQPRGLGLLLHCQGQAGPGGGEGARACPDPCSHSWSRAGSAPAPASHEGSVGTAGGLQLSLAPAHRAQQGLGFLRSERSSALDQAGVGFRGGLSPRIRFPPRAPAAAEGGKVGGWATPLPAARAPGRSRQVRELQHAPGCLLSQPWGRPATQAAAAGPPTPDDLHGAPVAHSSLRARA